MFNNDDNSIFQIEKNEIVQNIYNGNLVNKINDEITLFNTLMESYSCAYDSMKKWKDKYDEAIKLAKLQPHAGKVDIKNGGKTFPFEHASQVMMPFILEAMLDFNARSAPDLVWGPNIVGTKIYGKETNDKIMRANRINGYLNFQLKELIPQWQENQDRGLLSLACVGTFYKETFYDETENIICSNLLLADEIIFNHEFSNFENAPDKFQIVKYSKNEIITFIRGPQEWDISEDYIIEEEEDSIEFIKARSWYDLDKDGIQEPYDFVLHVGKQKIVSVYAAYDEESIIYKNNTMEEDIIKVNELPRYTQYKFLPDPAGGPMGLGWGILMGPLFSSINTTVRQLIDAGTLSVVSSNSGLLAINSSGRGSRQQSGPIDIKLGQLTPIPIDTMNGSLSQNLMQFPAAGPSMPLFELTRYLIDSARQMTNISTKVETNSGEAASLYLARLQQGLKIPNVINMRLQSAQKEEIKKIAYLNYKNGDNKKYNIFLDEPAFYSIKQDFFPEDCDIRLTADAYLGSDIERLTRAQAILQLAKEGISIGDKTINIRNAIINILEVMNVPNIENLVTPVQQEPNQQQQLMIAQAQMEAEIREREQKIKEKGQQLQEQAQQLQSMRLAHDAAKNMSEIGLKADLQEADIAKKYSETLANLMKYGFINETNNIEKGIDQVQDIENNFIDNTNEARNISNVSNKETILPTNLPPNI